MSNGLGEAKEVWGMDFFFFGGGNFWYWNGALPHNFSLGLIFLIFFCGSFFFSLVHVLVLVFFFLFMFIFLGGRYMQDAPCEWGGHTKMGPCKTMQRIIHCFAWNGTRTCSCGNGVTNIGCCSFSKNDSAKPKFHATILDGGISFLTKMTMTPLEKNHSTRFLLVMSHGGKPQKIRGNVSLNPTFQQMEVYNNNSKNTPNSNWLKYCIWV